MHLRSFKGLVLTATLASAVTMACGGGKTEAPASSAPPAAAPAKIDEAQAGNISGKVTLDGKAGANDAIKMNADPVCVREAKGAQTQEFYLVGDAGSLQNVFVYVKEGLGNQTFTAPSEAAVIDQKGCRYHPHVFGMMVGHEIKAPQEWTVKMDVMPIMAEVKDKRVPSVAPPPLSVAAAPQLVVRGSVVMGSVEITD